MDIGHAGFTFLPLSNTTFICNGYFLETTSKGMKKKKIKKMVLQALRKGYYVPCRDKKSIFGVAKELPPLCLCVYDCQFQL